MPFRALRYDALAVGELRDVVSPPYDVISPAEQRALARRHPRNVVRLDLPLDEAGDPPDERYRRAARDLAAWRSDGTLRKDRQASVYVYEEAYTVPGSSEQRVQRGFFARLRLEEPGPGSGVIPHERTLSAPKEDRYRLLRATGMNASPVVLLFTDAAGEAARALESATRLAPVTDLTDDGGVRHRLWQLPVEDLGAGPLAATSSKRGQRDRSLSPMGITATRPRCAITTSGIATGSGASWRRSTTCWRYWCPLTNRSRCCPPTASCATGWPASRW